MAANKVAVLYGGYRPQRFGIRLANFLVKKLVESNHEVQLFDAMKMPFKLLEKPLHFYKEGESPGPPEWLVKVNNDLTSCDSLVVVSGEYNFAPQPGLLNMLDHFLPVYRYKVAAITSYSAGSFPGIRASCTMRETLTCLETIIAPYQFTVPLIMQAFTDEDGTPAPDRKERLDSGAKRLIEEIDWLSAAIKNQAKIAGLPKK